MELEICRGRAHGTAEAPPSKSMAHRLLFCAGLSAGQSAVRGLAFPEDVLATLGVLRALGADCRLNGSTALITGADPKQAQCSGSIDCRESASTLRFCIPLLLLSGRPFVLTGAGRLLRRPLGVFGELCRRQGLRFELSEEQLRVQGPLRAGGFVLPGGVSSQFVSGLLFALPLLPQESRIRMEPPVVSRSYIEMTLQALRMFGVRAAWDDTEEKTLRIPGGQRFLPQDVTVEGCCSGAAFFGALAALGDPVTVTGLGSTLQGDCVYAQYFDALTRGRAALDVSDCPDLAPVLMAAAACCHGAHLTGTRRLRFKESNRGAAMAQELRKLGVRCTVREDSIEVEPGYHAPAEPLDAHGDHRIAMACAVLLTRTGGVLSGAEAVRKSFPDFFTKLQGLGITINGPGR